MLTTPERLAFILLTVTVLILTGRQFATLRRALLRSSFPARRATSLQQVIQSIMEIGLQRLIFKSRPVLSAFHALIFLGFLYYVLIDVNDLLEGFLNGYTTPGLSRGIPGVMNLIADLLTLLVILSMSIFLLRRFVFKDPRLDFHENVATHPKLNIQSIRRDSWIVGGFILLHAATRLSGQALWLAREGASNPMQPIANLYATWLPDFSEDTFLVFQHLDWWLEVGLVLAFLPYLIQSKHIHLLMAPLNLILKKNAPPPGRLNPSPTTSIAEPIAPGASTLSDLGWAGTLDAYACIMCNRCQDVCPAYLQGLPLSPSTLEINKRTWLNTNLRTFADGAASPALVEFAISPDAVWSCLTCAACVQICPVGAEPMADIVQIRRQLVYDGLGLDISLQNVLERITHSGNCFGQAKRNRAKWTSELQFEIKDIRRQPAEFLWFVDDFASFDPRVQEITRMVARVFQQAGVDFGILFEAERNAGNDVRRVGEEGLFEDLVTENIQTLELCSFQRLVTTDPHTYNTLVNEYPEYGGRWEVIHYTHLLDELVVRGRIQLKQKLTYRATFHDPCYLGRYNGIFNPPRELIRATGCELVEMTRCRENSFCCGAGGGQIWMDPVSSGNRPAEMRIHEALASLRREPLYTAPNGKPLLFTVTCPKDFVMYTEAVKSTGNDGQIIVRDIAQLVAEAMGLTDFHHPSDS